MCVWVCVCLVVCVRVAAWLTQLLQCVYSGPFPSLRLVCSRIVMPHSGGSRENNPEPLHPPRSFVPLNNLLRELWQSSLYFISFSMLFVFTLKINKTEMRERYLIAQAGFEALQSQYILSHVFSGGTIFKLIVIGYCGC